MRVFIHLWMAQLRQFVQRARGTLADYFIRADANGIPPCEVRRTSRNGAARERPIRQRRDTDPLCHRLGGSPFGGRIRYGDFTHETWFTAYSVRQLAAEPGAIGGHIVTQNITFAALWPPSPDLPLPGGLASPVGQAPGDRMSAAGR
jgi:hypothetical protein